MNIYEKLVEFLDSNETPQRPRDIAKKLKVSRRTTTGYLAVLFQRKLLERTHKRYVKTELWTKREALNAIRDHFRSTRRKYTSSERGRNPPKAEIRKTFQDTFGIFVDSIQIGTIHFGTRTKRTSEVVHVNFQPKFWHPQRKYVLNKAKVQGDNVYLRFMREE